MAAVMVPELPELPENGNATIPELPAPPLGGGRNGNRKTGKACLDPFGLEQQHPRRLVRKEVSS